MLHQSPSEGNEDGGRAKLTVDIRRHSFMGIVFTLHEQQELLSRRDVCDYSIKYLQETNKGWGGKKKILSKGHIDTKMSVHFLIP